MLIDEDGFGDKKTMKNAKKNMLKKINGAQVCYLTALCMFFFTSTFLLRLNSLSNQQLHIHCATKIVLRSLLISETLPATVALI